MLGIHGVAFHVRGALMLALSKGIKRLSPNDDGDSSSDRYKYLSLVAVWDKAAKHSGPICTNVTSAFLASHRRASIVRVLVLMPSRQGNSTARTRIQGPHLLLLQGACSMHHYAGAAVTLNESIIVRDKHNLLKGRCMLEDSCQPGIRHFWTLHHREGLQICEKAFA